MKSLTIEFQANGDHVIASAGDIAVGREDTVTAVCDLVLAYEAVNGPLAQSGEFVFNLPDAASAFDFAATPSRSSVSPDGIRAIIQDAVDSPAANIDVLIRGVHADGSPMDERVVKPESLDGNLLGAHDYLNDAFRNFRIDRLSYVTTNKSTCEDWFAKPPTIGSPRARALS